MRAELEEEARLSKEEQKNLEKNVLALEEKVIIEELNKEKAVIEELKNRNKAAKDAVAKLKAKKKKLETKLGEAAQKSEAPSPEKEKEEMRRSINFRSSFHPQPKMGTLLVFQPWP
jgi:DNA repair exonuclease SbcCD ATPase subunit